MPSIPNRAGAWVQPTTTAWLLSLWLGACGVPAADAPDRAPIDTAASASWSDTTNTCSDGYYDGPMSLDHATIACSEGRLRLDGETLGWASGGFLILQDEDGWTEEHDVVDTLFDACGMWCLIEREVATGATPTEWEPNRSTALSCDAPFTWAVAVQDLDGVVSDCRVFGAHPQRLLDSGVDPAWGCRVQSDPAR